MLIKWKFKKIGKSKFSDRVLREFLGCVARRGATSHQGAQGMGVGGAVPRDKILFGRKTDIRAAGSDTE